MRVFFVRHGESTGNAGQPCHDLSLMPLTATGRAQALRVAQAWDEAPGLIAVSPYLRAQQTAQPTLARFPRTPCETLPMEEFTYLEPQRWNGSSRAERLPFIEAYWDRGDPLYRDGPGAESFMQLLDRVDRTLSRLTALPPDTLVYAFSHGQFMQALRVSLLFPHWSVREKMAGFWPFNVQHPILNGDRLALRYAHGVWSEPDARAVDRLDIA